MPPRVRRSWLDPSRAAAGRRSEPLAASNPLNNRAWSKPTQEAFDLMTASEPKSERLKKELRAARPSLQREPRFPHETSRTRRLGLTHICQPKIGEAHAPLEWRGHLQNSDQFCLTSLDTHESEFSDTSLASFLTDGRQGQGDACAHDLPAQPARPARITRSFPLRLALRGSSVFVRGR